VAFGESGKIDEVCKVVCIIPCLLDGGFPMDSSEESILVPVTMAKAINALRKNNEASVVRVVLQDGHDFVCIEADGTVQLEDDHHG
jgi:hypothetical protein